MFLNRISPSDDKGDFISLIRIIKPYEVIDSYDGEERKRETGALPESHHFLYIGCTLEWRGFDRQVVRYYPREQPSGKGRRQGGHG
jgi:hypothetical protein